MGMTFPFPVDKTAIDQGRLIKWTKGFAASGAVGNDVVRLLQAALDHEKVHVVCNAFINDVGLWHVTRICAFSRTTNLLGNCDITYPSIYVPILPHWYVTLLIHYHDPELYCLIQEPYSDQAPMGRMLRRPVMFVVSRELPVTRF